MDFNDEIEAAGLRDWCPKRLAMTCIVLSYGLKSQHREREKEVERGECKRNDECRWWRVHATAFWTMGFLGPLDYRLSKSIWTDRVTRLTFVKSNGGPQEIIMNLFKAFTIVKICESATRRGSVSIN